MYIHCHLVHVFLLPMFICAIGKIQNILDILYVYFCIGIAYRFQFLILSNINVTSTFIELCQANWMMRCALRMVLSATTCDLYSMFCIISVKVNAFLCVIIGLILGTLLLEVGSWSATTSGSNIPGNSVEPL